MYFIDLNKLKVIKEFQYHNFETNIELDLNNAAATNKEIIKWACDELMQNHASIATCYRLDFTIPNITEEDFISLVNLATAVFFESFVLTGGRPRERRLDIPEKLTCAHISAGLLKRAINTKTVTDVFNLVIDCGDFHYIMLDTKETEANE